eukprot:TRINITY_DN13839_c0_g1_i2.p1 TRINITY_DN13839_c0_g1~~TRINITY_DN13839_c0_g1_i2.p1  ORF type:complete len:167 (+),score=32.65 TRINITY_DN13839_c0_g1_i2:158-658(+)
MDDVEFAEYTLLICKEVFVYKIPPRTSAAAYKCAEWGLSNPAWTGRLRMVAQGNNAKIILEDPATSQLFAEAPMDEKPEVVLEAVSDSSRYFVLRISDGRGHHALIGIGFRERNEAFDFNVAVQSHFKQRTAAQQPSGPRKEEPKLDLSLQEGQKIHINIAGVSCR